MTPLEKIVLNKVTPETVPDPSKVLVHVTGHVEGYFAVSYLDRKIAAAMLPKDTHLHSLDGSEKHPLIFLFAEQQQARIVAGSPLTMLDGIKPFGESYGEFALAIPLVQDRTGETHVFMPRLYLDGFRPVLVGRLPFGYDKRMSVIDSDGINDWDHKTYYKVFPMGSDIEPIISAQFELGRKEKIDTDGNKFSAIRRMFEAPLIAKNIFNRLSPRQFGEFFHSAYDWRLGDAVIHRIPEFSVDIPHGFLGMRGKVFDTAQEDLRGAGAYQISGDWNWGIARN